MAEGREHLGLALKPRHAVGIAGKGLGQDLDRHVALELEIARPVHLAHTTGPERREDFVWAETGAGAEDQTVVR